MRWIYSSSKFKYDGNPVERRKAKCKTPLGELIVFESVGGRPMMQYFYIGFGRDNNGHIVPHLNTGKMPCGTLEAGVLMQEIKWKELIDKMIDS